MPGSSRPGKTGRIFITLYLLNLFEYENIIIFYHFIILIFIRM